MEGQKKIQACRADAPSLATSIYLPLIGGGELQSNSRQDQCSFETCAKRQKGEGKKRGPSLNPFLLVIHHSYSLLDLGVDIYRALGTYLALCFKTKVRRGRE